MFRSKAKPLDRATLRAERWSQAPTFFVLSTGRCGTRTLARILDLSSDASVQHEPIPRLNRQCRQVYEEWESRPDVFELMIETCREDFVYSAYEDGLVYGETANRLTYFAPAINRVFSNSRFIHLLRDPRDVVRSGMDRGWYDSNKWDEGRIVPRPGDPYAERWSDLDLFDKCAWFWYETNRYAREFLATLAPERTFTLQSEGLFTGELEKLASVFEFLELEMPRTKKIKKVLDKKENYQRHRSFPDKARWSDEQNARLGAIAGELMEVYGY